MRALHVSPHLKFTPRIFPPNLLGEQAPYQDAWIAANTCVAPFLVYNFFIHSILGNWREGGRKIGAQGA
jgi:hypothetical protein